MNKDQVAIGKAGENIAFDTHVYKVEHPDIRKSSIAASFIAENMFANVYVNGNIHVLFKEITDHQNNALEANQQDALIATQSWSKNLQEASKGQGFFNSESTVDQDLFI